MRALLSILRRDFRWPVSDSTPQIPAKAELLRLYASMLDRAASDLFALAYQVEA